MANDEISWKKLLQQNAAPVATTILFLILSYTAYDSTKGTGELMSFIFGTAAGLSAFAGLLRNKRIEHIHFHKGKIGLDLSGDIGVNLKTVGPKRRIKHVGSTIDPMIVPPPGLPSSALVAYPNFDIDCTIHTHANPYPCYLVSGVELIFNSSPPINLIGHNVTYWTEEDKVVKVIFP